MEFENRQLEVKVLVKELQSLSLNICVQDKDGNDIELSELCREDDSFSSRDGYGDYGRHYTEEEIRRSFQIENDDGTPEEEAADEDEEYYDDSVEDFRDDNGSESEE